MPASLTVMRGALIGIGLVLVASVAWTVFILLTSWLSGDLDRTFPDCDPCGFVGYASRMLILSAMFIGIFGVPAAVAGWLIERLWVRHRRA